MGDGHTEALQITFDPDAISFEEVLNSFFRQHKPSKSSEQYKSAIWYASDEQKRIAEKVIASQGEAAQKYTELAPSQAWYEAEDYHQRNTVKKLSAYACFVVLAEVYDYLT
jgi:peptide-methionine (S)-S-oxide reductase